MNSTILAYGSTGSGKTFTITGNEETERQILEVLSPKDTVDPTNSCQEEYLHSDMQGILPRSLHTIFSELAAHANTDHIVKCSYLEVYNEELLDLLRKPEEQIKKIHVTNHLPSPLLIRPTDPGVPSPRHDRTEHE